MLSGTVIGRNHELAILCHAEQVSRNAPGRSCEAGCKGVARGFGFAGGNNVQNATHTLGIVFGTRIRNYLYFLITEAG